MATPESPNIILVDCDDPGYGDSGCYGFLKNQTRVLVSWPLNQYDPDHPIQWPFTTDLTEI